MARRHDAVYALRRLVARGLALALAILPVMSAGAQDGDTTVTIAPTSAYGPILTDGNGWTLYTWDGDAPGQSNCYGSCAEVWPPFAADGDPMALAELPGALGLLARDGLWQVTYQGWPLYYYVDDLQPGDTRGEGLIDTGARWSVVSAAAPAELPGAGPPTPPQLPGIVALPPGFTAPSLVPPVVAPQPAGAVAMVATGVPITMFDFEFRPANATVRAGDTVVWANTSATPHTATSDASFWDTRPLQRGQSGSYTFTATGSFPYHCALHPSMRGTITVSTIAVPQVPAGSPASPFASPLAPGANPFPSVGLGELIGSPSSTVTTVAPVTGSIILMWSPSPVAQSYRVYQSTASPLPSFGLVLTVSQSVGSLVTNAQVRGLQPGASYLFQVRAVDANGVETVVLGSSLGGVMAPAPR